jgi:hypothetical protein
MSLTFLELQLFEQHGSFFFNHTDCGSAKIVKSRNLEKKNCKYAIRLATLLATSVTK